MKPYYQDNWVTQYCSDALTILRGLEGDTVDLLCTDPPYGIGFMGKDWDKALPDKEIWAECLRVLKPGAFAFVMSIPRSDCLSRMIISLEDAGFNVGFSPIYHTFASGFPKAQNISKAVDKRGGNSPTLSSWQKYLRAKVSDSGISQSEITKRLGNFMLGHYIGDSQPAIPVYRDYLKLKEILNLDSTFDEFFNAEAEREVIGQRIKARAEGQKSALPTMGAKTEYITVEDTLSSTPQAKALDGSYSFNPKPAVEVIIVAQKPMTEKTYVGQALLWYEERQRVLCGLATELEKCYNVGEVQWEE